MFRLHIFAILSVLTVVACDDRSTKKAVDQTPKVDVATPDSGAGDAARKADAGPLGQVEPATPLSPPLRALPPASEELLEALPEEPIGSLSGDLFGQNRRLRAVARVSCGEGTVLQGVYDHGPGTELRITPPIPLFFFALETGKPVVYSDRGFEVNVDFDEDRPERLSGKLVVTFEEKGEKKTYLNMEMDGEPLTTLLVPRVDGDGRLPRYTQCVPTGYFTAKDATRGETIRGLVHAVNLKGMGAPLISIPLTQQDVLNILVIPPDPNTEFEEMRHVVLSDVRERGSRPATIRVDAYHTPEITSPAEALGKNKADAEKTMVLQGEADYRQWKVDGQWHIALALEDIKIPDLISGPLKGREFEHILVSTTMVADDELDPTLVAEPDWWKKEEGAAEMTDE